MSELSEFASKVGGRLRQLMARTEGDLQTVEKANLVAAINELAARPIGSTTGPATETASAIAGETLGGHRAVYVGDDAKAYYADSAVDACRRTIGITSGAASAGASASIQIDGVIEEPGWAWSGNSPVWLTSAGLLAQAPPATNYLFQVGVPIGPTKLRVAPQLVARI